MISCSDYDKVIILLYKSETETRVKKKTQGFVLNGKFALLVALIARGYYFKSNAFRAATGVTIRYTANASVA